MEDNYVYGDVPVKASVFSSQNASSDAIVEMADNIWKKVRAGTINENTVYQEYKDFCTSFPIVIKWMVYLKTYDKRAFKKFLELYASKKCNSIDEYLAIQAEYLVIIYKHRSKNHISVGDMNKYREFVVGTLKKEHDEFMEMQKEVEKELELAEKNRDSVRRQDLYEKMQAIRDK